MQEEKHFEEVYRKMHNKTNEHYLPPEYKIGVRSKSSGAKELYAKTNSIDLIVR